MEQGSTASSESFGEFYCEAPGRNNKLMCGTLSHRKEDNASTRYKFSCSQLTAAFRAESDASAKMLARRAFSSRLASIQQEVGQMRNRGAEALTVKT